MPTLLMSPHAIYLYASLLATAATSRANKAKSTNKQACFHRKAADASLSFCKENLKFESCLKGP